MSRIDDAFASLRHSGGKGLIVFLTAGDPSGPCSLDYLRAAADGGADVLEVGVPFSDPMADGPTIQAASLRALKGGMTAGRVLSLIDGFRRTHGTPLVIFGYFNPFLQYGLPGFCRDARAAGADGILVVDLPYEESGEMAPLVRRAGLDWIPLASPTSERERIRRISETGSGFFYLISVTGITGMRGDLPPKIASWTREVRALTPLPLAVGFGISTPRMARRATRFADAAVVGSACVKVVEDEGKSRGGPKTLRRFVLSLKKELR